MPGVSKLPPAGVSLNPLSSRVFASIAEFSAFPWPIMAAQCKRVGSDATRLDAETLGPAIDHIASSVARFTSPEKGEKLRERLLALAQGEEGPDWPHRDRGRT